MASAFLFVLIHTRTGRDVKTRSSGHHVQPHRQRNRLDTHLCRTRQTIQTRQYHCPSQHERAILTKLSRAVSPYTATRSRTHSIRSRIASTFRNRWLVVTGSRICALLKLLAINEHPNGSLHMEVKSKIRVDGREKPCSLG